MHDIIPEIHGPHAVMTLEAIDDYGRYWCPVKHRAESIRYHKDFLGISSDDENKTKHMLIASQLRIWAKWWRSRDTRSQAEWRIMAPVIRRLTDLRVISPEGRWLGGPLIEAFEYWPTPPNNPNPPKTMTVNSTTDEIEQELADIFQAESKPLKPPKGENEQ